jgi:hypothetical protein
MNMADVTGIEPETPVQIQKPQLDGTKPGQKE